jgi:hypothetical protein
LADSPRWRTTEVARHGIIRMLANLDIVVVGEAASAGGAERARHSARRGPVDARCPHDRHYNPRAAAENSDPPIIPTTYARDE